MSRQNELKNQAAFTLHLMEWHRCHNTRNLPWQQSRDPYKIWLSEIILQQTRVVQGLPYYQKFITAFPNIQALAAAPDDVVLKLWEGLGYYSRCRNLLATARYLVKERNGIFPASYAALIRLKGVGAYTAAAIASFAFGLPHAVVDGNVFRVLSRCFGLETPIDSTAGKKAFQAMANQLIDQDAPGGFNQAMMDLGATVCTPRSPVCGQCPLAGICVAKGSSLVDILPQRRARLSPRIRHFHYFLLCRGQKIWLHQRIGKDIWQGLYEPLLIETDKPVAQHDWPQQPEFLKLLPSGVHLKFLGVSRQRLTHQIISAQFFSLDLTAETEALSGGIWVSKSRLKDYAFPRTLTLFFDKLTTFK